MDNEGKVGIQALSWIEQSSFRNAKVDPGTKLSNLATKFLKFAILNPANK